MSFNRLSPVKIQFYFYFWLTLWNDDDDDDDDDDDGWWWWWISSVSPLYKVYQIDVVGICDIEIITFYKCLIKMHMLVE